MRILKITFLDEENKKHNVLFNLYDSSLAKRWQEIVIKNFSRSNNQIHSVFINNTFKNIPRVLKRLNETSELINNEYDKVLPSFINTDTLDQNILNDLHKEYEIYGGRLDTLIANNTWSEKLHNNFLKLNELIHTCEELIENKDVDFIPMSVLFDCYPQEIHSTILEKDKIYLTNSFSWGKLYLGYNTLGKDWLEISRHNDVDVVKRQQVKPQERFAAEAWINFSPDDTINHNNVQFEKWYDSLPFDIQKEVPVHNLNKLCLGRFEIGSVRINSYFKKYSDAENWNTINHKCKEEWNRNVFSTFTKIIDITFDEEIN